MNKIQRKILKRARNLIENCDERYICGAIDTVIENNPSWESDGGYLKSYIDRQLGGNVGLWGWQRRNGLNPESRNHRKDRLQWIDWMLGDLK